MQVPNDTIQELTTILDRLTSERDDLVKKVAALQEVILIVVDERKKQEGRIRSSANSRVLREALYQRLLSVGRPMNRRVLYEHLVNSGIPVNGDNPLNNVGAHMSNDDRFVSMGDGMWGLREWQRHIRVPTVRPKTNGEFANPPF